jgi:hypothetical protein
VTVIVGGASMSQHRRLGYDYVVQVKGNSFRGFIAALRRQHGEATADKVIALLPVELGRRMQRDNIVTGHWYPLAELQLVQQAMMRVVGRGPEVIREIARESTLEDFRGLYQVLTFMLTPQFIIKRTPGIWKRYYDGGVVSVSAQPGSGEARFSACVGFDEAMWQGVIGGTSGVLEACGAKGLAIEILDGGSGDHMAIRATWR